MRFDTQLELVETDTGVVGKKTKKKKQRTKGAVEIAIINLIRNYLLGSNVATNGDL